MPVFLREPSRVWQLWKLCRSENWKYNMLVLNEMMSKLPPIIRTCCKILWGTCKMYLVWNKQLKRLHIYFTCKTFQFVYFSLNNLTFYGFCFHREQCQIPRRFQVENFKSRSEISMGSIHSDIYIGGITIFD